MKLSKHTHSIKKIWSFTLIEMVIVLLIISILTMLTMWLSGEQIDKVQNKAIKESFMSEWQSHYSRNLWSSSFANHMYEYMDVSLFWWDNQLSFHYQAKDWNAEKLSEASNDDIVFSDKFIIDWDKQITIRYTPYNLKCKWGTKDEDWEFKQDMENSKLEFAIKVRDLKYYCFEINENNCRLIEIKCNENIINNDK